MLRPGVYPASATPLAPNQKVDDESLAKLLAWFESAGCRGVVLAGTNGEGPSLSAPEKRSLIESASKLQGELDLILGIATPSLDEAVWLSRRAREFGAAAVLVMPPAYFREANETGIAAWFERLMEASPVPVLAYNFPQRTGIALSPELLQKLARHEQMAGVKDSSGEESNLKAYRQALGPEKVLFVGNETLLISALEAGWTGTISGAANVVPHWLCQILEEWARGQTESAVEKFAILRPVLEAIRQSGQPAANKAVLARFNIIASDAVRLPLEPCAKDVADCLIETLRSRLGMTPEAPWPPS